MDDPADKLADALRVLIREQLGRSPAFRAAASELARWVLAEAEQTQAQGAQDAENPGPAEPAPESTDDHASAPAESATGETGVVPLRIGDAEVQLEVPGTLRDLAAASAATLTAPVQVTAPPGPPADAAIDLATVVRRCRLKAASCRLFIERRAAAGDPQREPALLERMDAQITEAKAIEECFLWAHYPGKPKPDDAGLTRAADGYDALAEAAELCELTEDPDGRLSRQETERAFQLLAEASSALRVAIGRTWLTAPDRDQDDTHRWLRRETSDRGIFVPRFMTLDDPADPSRVHDLRTEIETLTATAADRQAAAKQAGELFNRAMYHARQLPPEGYGREHDCRTINDALEQIHALGVALSTDQRKELRATARRDAFPPDTPAHPWITPKPPGPAVGPTGEEREQHHARESRAWSDRVLEARALLGGGGVVVVGGESRPDAIARIRDAFALDYVDWVALTEHASGAPLRPPIVRPDTRAVLVLIRLCGHLHADDARRYAREAGKPCVSLPAGYNPEQIAEQLLGQAGLRLEAT